MSASSPLDGHVIERRGISPVPGLYFVGRDWQWSRGSALLCGVDRDAAHVAGVISARRGGGLVQAAAPSRAGTPAGCRECAPERARED